MKNLLKKTLIGSLTAIVLLGPALTVAAKSKEMGIAFSNQDIRRILVTGNTKVTIVQSSRFWVAVDEEDLDKVSIKQIGIELQINSSEQRPIRVTVHIATLFRVVATNTATVETLGTFNQKYLQVILKDNAVARLKTNTEGLYTMIGDHSSLKLLGSTQTYTLQSNSVATLDTNKFAALITKLEPASGNDTTANAQLKRKY